MFNSACFALKIFLTCTFDFILIMNDTSNIYLSLQYVHCGLQALNFDREVC